MDRHLAPGMTDAQHLAGDRHPHALADQPPGHRVGVAVDLDGAIRLHFARDQSFHQMPMAPALVGATRESCQAYIGHFLRHWAHRQEWLEDGVLEAWVDNFLKPGNLAGGFAYYQAAHAGRVAIMREQAPGLPPIGVPTCVRWAEHDVLFPYAWTDRLGETFADLDLAMFEGVGHFPHREHPDRTAAEIAGFFSRIGHH